jgi:hypothetical protein
VSNPDTWRNRPLEVRVLTRCDECSTLKEKVERREHRSLWPTYFVSLMSCAGCFETAKQEAAAQAEGLIIC